ncbi:hypothetical protein DLS57_12980, partial [Staphylococcus pseudintermedius]
EKVKKRRNRKHGGDKIKKTKKTRRIEEKRKEVKIEESHGKKEEKEREKEERRKEKRERVDRRVIGG